MTTNTPLRLDAAELRRLIEPASKGVIVRDKCSSPNMQVLAIGNEVVVFHARHNRQVGDRVVPNFELIEYLWNTTPDILALLEENERLREAAQGAHKLLSRHGLGESVENEEWRQATASLATALSERPADRKDPP